MKWQCREYEDLLFVDKPEGTATHAVEAGQLAFVESWEKARGEKLWVTHRLDKKTSGAMVFARSAAAAERLRVDFSERRVKKKYLFLTDRKSAEMTYFMESDIQKLGPGFVSQPGPGNARTSFKMLKRSTFYELWEAQPETGKSHQIRLHARDLGLTILGDEMYGGTAFPRLCLHSAELHIPGAPPWITPPPRLFERLGLLRDPELTEILSILDRRERKFHFLGDRASTLRLYDREFRDYSLEQLGEVLWLSWFQDQDPTLRDLERWDLIGRLTKRPVLIQKRWDRGDKKAAAPKWILGEVPPVWTAEESGRRFEFRTEQGESHGLFLDQRRNRLEIAEASRGKSLLNLFAYTGGFSVMAATNGSGPTTTVDLSPAAIKWAQQNFALNQIPTDSHEFFATDAFFFLERAVKKERRWDIVVLDPPIFSRSKDRVFRIEKNLGELLKLAKRCLTPKGLLFFSTHFEGWDQNKLMQILENEFPQAKIHPGQVDDDFVGGRNALKSFFLRF